MFQFMKLNHKSIKNLAIIYYIPEMNEWNIFYTLYWPISTTIRKIGSKIFESIVFMLTSLFQIYPSTMASLCSTPDSWNFYSFWAFLPYRLIICFPGGNIFIWYWRYFCTLQTYKCFIVLIGSWPFQYFSSFYLGIKAFNSAFK